MQKIFAINVDNDKNKTKKIQLWIDEVPEIDRSFDKVSIREFEIESMNIGIDRRVCIEISYNRHSTNYALLGAEYFPNNSNKLTVEIHYNDINRKRYENSNNIFNKGKKYCGLLYWYVSAIYESIDKIIAEGNGLIGKIVFDVAANCIVGSSDMVFGEATEMIMKLLNDSKNYKKTYEQILLL